MERQNREFEIRNWKLEIGDSRQEEELLAETRRRGESNGSIEGLSE